MRKKLVVFIPQKVYVDVLHTCTVDRLEQKTNNQLPRVIAHLVVFMLFYRPIVEVQVATGFFTHTQLVLIRASMYTLQWRFYVTHTLVDLNGPVHTESKTQALVCLIFSN